MEWLALLLFAMVFIALMIGFPVALTLAGMSLLFALASDQFGWFDMAFFKQHPQPTL